jgi:two-component system alkaline phosphatase synthesis response regulator PhoP
MGDSKPMRILVVDDDEDILQLLKYNLEREGFKVKTVEQSVKALRVAWEFCPDLIILDLMMPHPNGIELCREFRSSKRFQQTYIFFLTAKSESYYQHAALQTGGDDYIEKITGLRSLTHKINSVLKKRFVIRKSITELTVGGLKINRGSASVRASNGDEIILNRNEFDLLFFFAQNPGRTITQENLVHILWGSDIYVGDKSIDLLIHNLSRKTGLSLIHKIYDNRYRLNIAS